MQQQQSWKKPHNNKISYLIATMLHITIASNNRFWIGNTTREWHSTNSKEFRNLSNYIIKCGYTLNFLTENVFSTVCLSLIKELDNVRHCRHVNVRLYMWFERAIMNLYAQPFESTIVCAMRLKQFRRRVLFYQ